MAHARAGCSVAPAPVLSSTKVHHRCRRVPCTAIVDNDIPNELERLAGRLLYTQSVMSFHLHLVLARATATDGTPEPVATRKILQGMHARFIPPHPFTTFENCVLCRIRPILS